MSDEKTANGEPTPTPATTAPAPDTTPKEAAITQADVDRIIKERLAREREKYADYDDLKAAAAKLREIEEAQLSETEKLSKQLEQERQARTQAEAMARERAIRSAVIAEAAKLNFNDPGDAYRLVDLGKVEFDDSGEPKNAAELVKQLAEERKYLIKQRAQALETFDPAGTGGPIRETDAQRRSRIYGNANASFFDPEAAKVAGGGVIWPKGMPQSEE